MKYLALIFLFPIVVSARVISRQDYQIDSFQSYYLNSNQKGLKVGNIIKNATLKEKNDALSGYAYADVKAELVHMVDEMLFKGRIPTYASFLVYADMVKREGKECKATPYYVNLRGVSPRDILIWYNGYIHDNCL
jgi:hypothetical protein|tara:strand:- start:4475 stop:4879 length:405 start_codon:yes stop_codon:yes gene_type:complete